VRPDDMGENLRMMKGREGRRQREDWARESCCFEGLRKGSSANLDY
jgi:hypothetical protein